ncbi:mitogen-activated protein kinase kinase kinase 7-like [Oppia nitens]|uniref:mitogen-activated protein kinase kinase kinase 7-like n=1 Tax=Oppia nitens TaxID=1686743 RepID=UPI0023DA4619|nr:mitogen-activated protein kinase kinase kinase 7-like [Oppia nitens]
MDSNVTVFNEIKSSEIKLAEVVGKGTFGVVRRGIWKGQEVAVKIIETEQEKKAFQIELRQLSRVSHPNIVKLYGATQDNGFVSLVMEYAEGGSLYNVLHSVPMLPYTLSHAISWVLQCARGVSYLHGMQPKALIHRDLKPPNLLLVSGGTILKICDFGTACDIHTHMTNNKGSAAWMAPEVFESWNYTEKCDVFSWGIILWEVLARKKPFDEIGGPAFRIMWAVHSGQRPPLLQKCPKVFENLMTKCWAKDPNQRPAMKEVEEIVEQIFKYCSQNANQPIINSHTNTNPYSCVDNSINSTNFSIDQQMQTQLDAPQQIVTEPPVLNMSGTNIIDPNDLLQSKNNPALSVPPNMSGLINNSSYNQQLNYMNKSLRRISEDQPANAAIDSSSAQLNTFTKGHKRSNSSGTPVTTMNSTSQSLNKSRSIIGLNDDQPVASGSSQALQKTSSFYTGRPDLPKLVVPSFRDSPPISSTNDQQQVASVPKDFNAYLVLESELQPIQPDTSNRESVKIFEEHKRMSQEYLRMKMEVTLLSSRKQELETSNKTTNSLEDYLALKQENTALIQLKSNLITQLNMIKRKQRQREAAADGDWVLIDRTDTQNNH